MPIVQDAPSAPVDLQVSPRFWYMWHTNATLTPSGISGLSQSGTYRVPLYGAAVSARFASLPDTTFILSVLHGNGTEEISSLGFGGGTAISARTRDDISRNDVEFLTQTRIPDTNWAWIAGFRYERDDQSLKTISLTLPPPGARLTVGDATGEQFSGKLGLAGTAQLTPAGNLNLFGNIMALGGVFTLDGSTFGQPKSSGTRDGIIGGDMSVGLQYLVTPNISFDARLRLLLTYDVSLGGKAFSTEVGPMLGANIRF
jgi:hypothetical protein